MSVKAISNNVRHSPRKVGEVAALVRGHSVNEALIILEHVPRRSAQAVKKCILSAKANAMNNHNYKESGLALEEIYVTAGARLKRFRPAAHGRALPFQRRNSNITVVLTGEQRAAKKPAAKKEEAK